MDSTISTKDLKSKLDKKQGITVIETLAPERYREAHLPGALNIPPENGSRNSRHSCCPTEMLRSSLTVRTRIDTPANTPP
jgi:3-mercaptopyruvate sulfurtransferase SseA